MSRASESRAILVTGGLHRGAHVLLPEAAMQVIGTADDCDICFADDYLEARHCAISLNDETLSVRSLGGAVTIDGKTVSRTTKLNRGSAPSISLGESGVTMKIVPQSELDVELHALDEPLARPANEPTNRKRFVAIAAASVMLTAFAVFATTRQEDTLATSTPDPIEETKATIDALGIDASIDVIRRDGSLLLSGIARQDDIATLNEGIRATAMPVTVRLVTPAQLLEQIGGVFRTNGYDAELTYRGDGSVFVKNLDPSDPAVSRVASFVRTDVPLLKNLGFSSSSTNGNDGTTVYLGGPGKRLTTVVDGDVAYIATEDGARYFEGSLLPDGQRVHRITESGVEIETSEGISLLSF